MNYYDPRSDCYIYSESPAYIEFSFQSSKSKDNFVKRYLSYVKVLDFRNAFVSQAKID